MSPAASIRPPFRLVHARSLSHVLLTCEHASNRLPFARGVGSAQRAALATHWGWDIGAFALTLALSRLLEAGAIGGRWSRLLIDLNRRVDDPTLVRRKAGRVVLPWNEDLDVEELERRVLVYHAPYHAEVDRLILRRVVRGVRPLLLAVHSFTPRLSGDARAFDIGVLYERDVRQAHRLGGALTAAGLRVRYNEPYSGLAGMMYSVDRHGSHHGLPCLEIEVNQRLFARRGAVERLARAIAPAVGELLGGIAKGA